MDLYFELIPSKIHIRDWYNKFGIKIKDINKRLIQYHKNILIMFGDKKCEQVEQYLCMKYISDDDIILEIGGNIGRVSFILATILKNDRNLLVLECNKKHYNELLFNKNINKLNFNIEPKALSLHKLYQIGWQTYTETEFNIFSQDHKKQATMVDNISYDNIITKYQLKFNTLVIDCEGAFYYIIQSFPNILDNIKKIIIENDYKNYNQYEFVENILLEKNFKTVETIKLPDSYKNCHPDDKIREKFYQVKIISSEPLMSN